MFLGIISLGGSVVDAGDLDITEDQRQQLTEYIINHFEGREVSTICGMYDIMTLHNMYRTIFRCIKIGMSKKRLVMEIKSELARRRLH
jgi:hypothetical protein